MGGLQGSRKRDYRVGEVKFWQFLRDIIYEQSLIQFYTLDVLKCIGCDKKW